VGSCRRTTQWHQPCCSLPTSRLMRSDFSPPRSWMQQRNRRWLLLQMLWILRSVLQNMSHLMEQHTRWRCPSLCMTDNSIACQGVFR
jgi:hypothetical protein